MRNVLLIDVALWGALIIMAALIIIQRWRRSHSRLPVRRPHWEAPEPAGQKMPAPQPPRRIGPGPYRTEPAGAAPRSARPPPAVSPQAVRPSAAQLAGPSAGPYRPGMQREERQPPARAATPSERIASYYDQADQPIADYLAARGWTQPPATAPLGQQAQTQVLPQHPQTARPAPSRPASSQQASGTGTRQDGRQGRGQPPPRLAGSR